MKTVVIGIGNIGETHLRVLAEERLAPVAVCDVDFGRTNVSGARRYTDYRRMLDEVRPDAVHICTPHFLHAEMIVEALNRGIHVLCEKPLCISEEEICAILRAEETSSAQLGVCFQNRYNPSTAFVCEYLAGKRIDAAFGMVVWRRDAAYYASAPWRGKLDGEGGGVMINQAIHTIDLLLRLCGMPSVVSARCMNASRGGVVEVEDTVCAHFSGERGNFDFYATVASGVDFPPEIRLFSEGKFVELSTDSVRIGAETKVFPQKTLGTKMCYGDSHARLIGDFYRCIRAGEKFPVDGREAAKAMRLVLAAYRSARTAREERI